jgi:hypothetical protein
MARTALTPVTPKGPYGTINAGDLVYVPAAADTSNGNKFPLTGHEVLLAENTDTDAHHITISSVADEEGRLGDVTSYAVAAGAQVAFSFRGGTAGWKQTDGNAYVSADDATVKFTVLRFSN